jgi:hypothetical protein
MVKMNDTYIVKRFWILLASLGSRLQASWGLGLIWCDFSGNTTIFNHIK